VKIPIPDDWDGERWRCVEVRWPDSPMWLAILHGLLSYPARGRLWDERSGIITDVQETGRQIWDKNTPLVRCASEGDPVARPRFDEIWGGGLIVESGESLGQVVTDVTVEDGVIYKWFGPCCKIAVGQIGDVGNLVAPAPVTENPDPETFDWACAKAYAVGHKFYDFLLSLEHIDESQPWNWDEDLQDANGLLFDEWEVVNLMLEYFTIQTIFDNFLDIEFTTVERDLVICKWAEMLDNSSNDLVYEDYKQMGGVMVGVFESTFGLEKAIVEHAWKVFGATNTRKIGRTAVNYPDAKCPCPESEGVEIPVEYDWIHYFDWRLGEWGWNIVDGTQIDLVGIKVADMVRYDTGCRVDNACPFDGQGSRKIVFVRHDYTEWPITETIYAVYWWQIGGVTWGDELLFGLPSQQKVFDLEFGEGATVRSGSFQATGDPTSGNHIIWRTIVAGTGPDPWPGVQPEDEWV